MDSLIERFNSVALNQAVGLETIDMDKKYRLLIFSNVDDGRGARVILSLMLGDNKLGRQYIPPQFQNYSPDLVY